MHTSGNTSLSIRQGGVTPALSRVPATVATLAFVVLGLVALGSLTPFEFDFAGPAARGELGRIGWPGLSVSDVATNFIVYLPIGAVLAVWVRFRASGRTAMVAALVAGAVFSLGLETLQTAIVGRYASWWDVAVNAFGAGVGGVAALRGSGLARRVATLFSERLRVGPAGALARLVTVGAFVYALAPFDFVRTAEELVRSLHRSELPLLATIHAGRLIPEGPQPFGVGLASLTLQDGFLAGIFLVLGCLVGLAEKRGRSSLQRLAAGAGAGWLIATVVETLQTFSSLNTFGLHELALNGSAATCGAVLAVFLHSRMPGTPIAGREADSLRSGGEPIPTAALLAFWFVPAALMAVRGGEALGGMVRNGVVPVIEGPLLADYFQMPFARAVGTFVELSGMYVFLAAATLMLGARLRSNRWDAPRLLLPVTVVLGVAALFGPTGTLSASTMLLVGLAVAVTMAVARDVERVMHTPRNMSHNHSAEQPSGNVSRLDRSAAHR